MNIYLHCPLEIFLINAVERNTVDLISGRWTLAKFDNSDSRGCEVDGFDSMAQPILPIP